VCVLNGALKEQLANLLQDTELTIKEVWKSYVIRILKGVYFYLGYER
jgi:hypothetical protein